MAITYNNHFTNTLPDTFKNNFQIIFNNIPNELKTLKDLPDKLEYRIQNFNIPSVAINKYTVNYLGEKVERIAGSLEQSKEVTFNVRVDRFWNVYKGFVEWRELVLGLDGESRFPDLKDNNIRTDITIKPIDVNARVAYTSKTNWDFKGCIITGIQEIEFNYETGEPIVVQINLSFIEMKDYV